MGVGRDHAKPSIMKGRPILIGTSFECADHEDEVTHDRLIVKTVTGRDRSFRTSGRSKPFNGSVTALLRGSDDSGDQCSAAGTVQREKSVIGDLQWTIRGFALAFGTNDRYGRLGEHLRNL